MLIWIKEVISKGASLGQLSVENNLNCHVPKFQSTNSTKWIEQCAKLFTGDEETSRGKEVPFPSAHFCRHGCAGELKDRTVLVSPAWCSMWTQSDEAGVSFLQYILLPCLQTGTAAYWVNSCRDLIYVHSLGGEEKKSASYLNIQHSSMFCRDNISSY